MSWTYDDARASLAETFCSNCREYKGMTTDRETGESYCMFCE
jgi:hypothetical protein